MLLGLQLQFSCLDSFDKGLETVTDNSIASACNLQLARRDTVLKVLEPYLNQYDFNRLRRAGFKSNNLVCPATINKAGNTTVVSYLNKLGGTYEWDMGLLV